MEKVGMARFLWDSLPQWTKRLLRFLWNLFPLEIEKFEDFIVKVKESREPVEIEKVNETVVSNYEQTYVILGRVFAVKLRSFAANGKEIIHKAFYAFLPADLNGQINEKDAVLLTQKLASEAQMIFETLNLKKIPIKIVT